MNNNDDVLRLTPWVMVVAAPLIVALVMVSIGRGNQEKIAEQKRYCEAQSNMVFVETQRSRHCVDYRTVDRFGNLK